MASVPIYGSRSQLGAQPSVRRIAEKATQTWLLGVPVTVDTSGYLTEWDGTTLTGAIAGISMEAATNRTASGVAQVSSGLVAPPNQANALIITLPKWDDGKLNIYAADQDTIFFGEVGPAQLASNAVVGVSYGLTKDADNHWYVDLTKTTTSGGGGTNQAVLVVVGRDSADGAIPTQVWDTRGVFFKFLAAAIQVVG